VTVALPTGTVTFLFTDIEGSSRLWEEHAGAMASALARHDELLGQAVSAHRGVVFSTGGDGLAAVFARALDAVRSAVDAQAALFAEQWPESMVLGVRMGLHTGEAEERDGDYFGPAVNRAARIMAAGHGGQVLVSLPTEELVRDGLPDGVTLVDLGEHALSGLARRERVFQVSVPGGTARFAPLRTESRVVGNVARPQTSFVGHAEELERLAAALPLRHLVTLTGVGGVGKTRLAVEAARSAGAEFPDGAWLCELAPVAEPSAVAHVVGTTLAVRLQEGLSMLDSVVDALRGRRLLLVLDNCEHLLDDAADLAERITASCPTVTVLATSREPLGVPGEWVWAVPSLDAEGEGVELFCDRAAAAGAFAPSEQDAAVIAGICARLDGIPLAIELAAARVRSMTVGDLAERLDDRFRLLRGGRRGLERHQTLRAAVQWSYQLLPQGERLLFDRLSVFAGSFDLAAAEAVCADEQVNVVDIAEYLAVLVDKSMVVADRAGLHARYRLLETLRQFGEERLADAGQVNALNALRDGHVTHYLGAAQQARRQYEGDAFALGATTLRAEWPNFRAAVQWAITSGDAPTASALLDAVFHFAQQEFRHEVGVWASEIVAMQPATTVAYGVAAHFAHLQGQHDEALRLAEAGLAVAESANDPGTWHCRTVIAVDPLYSGRGELSWAAWQTLNQNIDPVDAPFLASHTAAFAAVVAVTGADPASAPQLVATAQRLAAPLANPSLDAIVAWAAGVVELDSRRYDIAGDYLSRALALAEKSGNLFQQGLITLSLSFLAVRSDSDNADRSLLKAVARLYENRDWLHTWPVVKALALYWLKTDRLEWGAVVLGHLQAHDTRVATFLAQRQQAQAALASTPEAELWMSRGAALEREELLAFILDKREAQTREPET
jgi:predicted ATPase/class 3 adenylate cyclase